MKLGVASRTSPHPDEDENGDGIFWASDGEFARFSVIDGLGHGAAAAEATRHAIQILGSLDLATPIHETFERLGDALRPTRGAAVLVARFQSGHLEGASVGNVALRQLGARLPVVLSPGIVGGRVAKVRVFEGPLTVGARLFAFTDGITGHFDQSEYSRLTRQDACDSILSRHRRERDDASILIADVEE